MNLVLSEVENAGLSDSSTCTLHPDTICCLARGSAFCHVDFASLGKGLSGGCHRRQQEILCLWFWLSGCCCYSVRGESSPPGFRERGAWNWVRFSLPRSSPFMPFYRELELQHLEGKSSVPLNSSPVQQPTFSILSCNVTLSELEGNFRERLVVFPPFPSHFMKEVQRGSGACPRKHGWLASELTKTLECPFLTPIYRFLEATFSNPVLSFLPSCLF